MNLEADLKSSTPPQDPPPPSERSPAAAAKGDDHHGKLNLAGLPCVVLVLLFKMLPVPDRGRLARTCLRLSTIMQCPSVWTDVCIQLHATITGESMGVSCLRPKDSSMVKKYGAYFQRTTIVFPYMTISEEAGDMLSKFTRREVKMKLILQQEFCIPSPGNLIHVPGHSLCEPVHDVIDMMDTFSSSTSISFEFPHRSFNLFALKRILDCNSKSVRFCSMLSELVLPEQWPEQKLAEIFDDLSPTPTAALISNFPALRRLTLSLHNASEELLLELSDSSGRRSPLRSLVFHHVDGRKSQPEVFPKLSSAAWSSLTSACPSLTVECYFVCHDMPPLSQVIKPKTPLVTLKVSCNEYSDTDHAQFDQVCREHKSTLHYYGLSAGIDPGIWRIQEYLKRTG